MLVSTASTDKAARSLPLKEALIAVIIRAEDHHLLSLSSRDLRQRIVVLDVEEPTPKDWSSAANDAAEAFA